MLSINNIKKREVLFYLLLVVSVIPVLAMRDFTLDNELRYMSIADEALRNSDIFTFTNHGLAYADKPPLYIWIIMLGKLIFGTHSMLFIGLFSVVPALVIIGVMDKWVKNAAPEHDRQSGRYMLITSGFFLGSALVMRMDMLMCMFIVLSLYTFFRIYSKQESRCDKYMFGVYVFLAIFSKGPIGILVPLVSTVTFLIIKRDIKEIGKYWGWRTLSVLIVLCGLWFTGVYSEGGPDYLNNLVFNQTVNRAVDSFHHKEPFYYYMVAIWYSLAPWSLLIIGILAVGIKERIMKTDIEKFFVTIALSTFIVLSLVSSKIQIYMLPAFPFFAYIAVIWLSRYKIRKWVTVLTVVPAVIFSLAFPATITAGFFPAVKESFPAISNFFMIGGSLILSAGGIYSLISLFNKKMSGEGVNKAINGMSVGMIAAIFVVSFALPHLNPNIGMGSLCKEAKEQAESKGIKRYYYYNIKRFENTDVYLGALPQEVSEDALKGVNPDGPLNEKSSIQSPAVLFFRQKDLDRKEALTGFVSNKEKHRVGDYFFVIL